MTGDSFMVIIVIFVGVIIMFVFPLMSLAERTDDISELSVQTSTTDFVDNVRSTGKLLLDDYDTFLQQLISTGNSFEIEMEAQILDENPGVKTTQAETTKIGENVYYILYTSQIEDRLNSSPDHTLTFKEGDRFSVTVKNTNVTIAQILRNFFYNLSGNGTYQIAAQHAGIVTVNGTK